MNVMMVGAGAVGGFYGARLVKAGVPCSFLLRAKTLAAVKQAGLSIHSTDQSFTVFPVASDDPRALPQPDLIILSVKRYDLEEVVGRLLPILTPDTMILTVQKELIRKSPCCAPSPRRVCSVASHISIPALQRRA